MQIGPLELPEELLSALEENRLVIFAGAGVSIPPPSSLPSFRKLVEEIVGHDLSVEEEGQMDRVLGRAKEREVPVHRLAAERLSRAKSSFNSLHNHLVTLFSSATAVRIVTTNFDRHFEGAMKARSELGAVEVYTAPALPVGSSFTGLAHLHGVLGRSPEELVLTDADFGRAYLTEGWAGRFVVELFREYTVLFVGYSYGDTVMSYLTRGLSFGRQRFALTVTGQREKWQLLGIRPIDYDPADGHRALEVGLGQWASYERRGFLDWGQRLATLANREPQALAPDEQGELEFCLKNPKRARLFYQHAKSPNWLQWAEDSGRLQPLFSFGGDQESLRELALWFTEDPLGPRGKVALQIGLQSSRPIGGALAVTASQQVNGAIANVGRVEEAHAQSLAAWATLLIERTAPNTPLALLGYWLDHLSPQNHPQLVVQILAHQMRCRPVFREASLWVRERGLSLLLETPSVADDLSRRWRGLREHIGALAHLLVPVITEVLEARWRWLANLEALSPASDPWGWRRPWVERPPGESSSHDKIYGRQVGPLLDIGKDVLDELLASTPGRAAAVIELWLAASAPQLVQLGLYGLAKSSHWKPAKKLERLLAGHLPARLPFKVEVFRGLHEAYPQLSQRQRERFIKRAGRLYRQEIEKRQDEPDRRRSASYEWFNFLAWLERAAPGDPFLKAAISAVRESYQDFQPRANPELDIVRAEAGWVQPISVLTFEEIARLSLPQWLDEMRASGARDRQGGSYKDHAEGFLEETARAASEQLEWGLAFTRDLLKNGLFNHEVWPKILAGWEGRAFKPVEWRRVLGILDNPDLLSAQVWGVTEVVRGRVKQKTKATATVLRSALRLAEKLLPLAEDSPFEILSEQLDWLDQAINHPGGKLAEFLVQSIGELLGPDPPRRCGIPKPCKRLLDAMISGRGKASAMGRVVLASHAHYFLWIDPEWTRASLLPLFEWDRDTLQAVQAWHGFLFWGRPGAAVLEELTLGAVQLASHLDELGGEREHYGRFVARSAFSVPDDPLSKAWFQAFLAKANENDHAQFAWELDNLLESLRPDQRAEIWRDWLNRYLERRTQFPPLPEGQEITAISGWAFNLPGQLSPLVERLEALPGRGASVGQLLWKLQENELAGSDPNLLARLVLALLKRSEKIDSWELPQLRAVIERMKGEGAQGSLLKELVEKYVEHGGLNPEELL